MASFALWGTAESAAAAAAAPYDAQTRIVTTRGLPPSLPPSLSLSFGELASNGEEDPTTMTSLTSHRIFQLRAPCLHWSVVGESITAGFVYAHSLVNPSLIRQACCDGLGASATDRAGVNLDLIKVDISRPLHLH